MSTSGRYGDTTEGTDITLDFQWIWPSGTKAIWASGVVRVLDADFERIAGFESDAEAAVNADDSTVLEYDFHWAAEAGKLPAIDSAAERYVVWVGTTTDGDTLVSQPRPWRHLPQRGR